MAEDMRELGSSGLRRTGGFILDDPLPSLRGNPGQRVYRDMADNDAICGSILFAIERLILGQDWRVDPYHDDDKEPTPKDEEVAQFVESCFHDLSESWEATLSGILTFLPYGWSFCETVYKRRLGPDSTDGSRRSKHNDGKIGWRKIVLRAQETLWEWDLDPEDGSVRGMVQSDPSVAGPSVHIPIERALLFRTTAARQNPEGKSLLRNAYRAWYIKRVVEDLEAIGVERDAVGMPVGFVPPSLLGGNATAEQLTVLANMKNIIKAMRRNENDGFLWPLSYDTNGNKLYDVQLLASGGQRQFDTDKIIARWDQRIAMSVLADFILLGHENVGSFALGASKVDLFLSAVSQFAWSIAETINRHAIPRLLRLNGMDAARCPKLMPTELSHVDLGVLGPFLQQMTAAGIITADEDLEDYVREVSGLPEANPAEQADEVVPFVPGQAPPPGAPPAPGAPPSPETPPPAPPAPAPVAKAETPAPAPIHVYLPAQAPAPAPTVNVTMPEQAAPVVNVHMADIYVPEQAPPVINVAPSDVHVQAAAAPVVTVQAAAAPEVRVDAPVTVNVPSQAAPSVTVQVPEQAPPNVTVHVDAPPPPAPPAPVRTIQFTRDATGKIVSASPIGAEE